MVINNFNDYIKKRFGKKLYKISLNAGMTCPNRDGKIDTRGCIFCSEGGSGDFAGFSSDSISKQIEDGIELLSGKFKAASNSSNTASYIAYFQAFTNTYASLAYLEKIYFEAAVNKNIAAISIATRPDCIDEDIAKLLIKINNIKPVFIEFGLQTSNEASANFIRRGYDNVVFENAISLIDKYNKSMTDPSKQIHIVVHMIIGLPFEDINHMIDTVKYINRFPVHGIKFQLLHILKGTDLATYYEKKTFKVLSMEEYTDILIELLGHIRPDIVIHRITGDGPKKLLIAPTWSGNKKLVLNYINKRILADVHCQGYNYCKDTGDNYVTRTNNII